MWIRRNTLFLKYRRISPLKRHSNSHVRKWCFQSINCQIFYCQLYVYLLLFSFLKVGSPTPRNAQEEENSDGKSAPKSTSFRHAILQKVVSPPKRIGKNSVILFVFLNCCGINDSLIFYYMNVNHLLSVTKCSLLIYDCKMFLDSL